MVEPFRERATDRGRNLEYPHDRLETCVAVSAGLLARSVAMIGFGGDSLIEVVSGSAVLGRMNVGHDDHLTRSFHPGTRSAHFTHPVQ